MWARTNLFYFFLLRCCYFCSYWNSYYYYFFAIQNAVVSFLQQRCSFFIFDQKNNQVFVTKYVCNRKYTSFSFRSCVLSTYVFDIFAAYFIFISTSKNKNKKQNVPRYYFHDINKCSKRVFFFVIFKNLFTPKK